MDIRKQHNREVESQANTSGTLPVQYTTRTLDIFKLIDRPIHLDVHRIKPYRVLNVKEIVNFFDQTTSVRCGFSQNIHCCCRSLFWPKCIQVRTVFEGKEFPNTVVGPL